MKTNIINAARTAALAVLVSAGAASAHADDAFAANERTSSGTVTVLDAKEKVLKIQGMLLSKTFALGDNCTLVTDNTTDTSLGQIRPGQKVTVNYRDADGVLVADRVTLDKMFFTGEVSAIDVKNHVLSVQQHGKMKTFGIADGCGVTLGSRSGGSLDDVKLGNHVTVIYETPNGRWVARWIEQPSLQFTGTLATVNLADRTLTAGKPLLGDKKFHIGDDCTVVVDGKLDAGLKDIHPGENCELSYETVNGVNILNRIAPVMATEKPGPAAQSTGTTTTPVARN